MFSANKNRDRAGNRQKTWGEFARFAFANSAVSEQHLFSATPCPDATYALTWSDGTAGRLSRKQWTKQKPVQAGYALHVGRENRAALRAAGWLDPAEQVDCIAFVVADAYEHVPATLLGWLKFGLFGGAPS